MTSPALPARRRRATRTFSFALASIAIAASSVYGVLGAGAGGAGAQTANAPAPGSGYVALGDSYAAGYGIGTSTGKPVTGCAQSTQDYPHQVAQKLKLKLTDVSCSGAVTADIDQGTQDTGGGIAQRQDLALTKSTKLVTVTIGGNDLGFSSIAAYCLAASPGGPVAGSVTAGNPQVNCKAHYDANGVDALAAAVRNTVVPRVARVLADIAKRAPHAAVYLVDYPAISTTKAGSPNPTIYPDSCYLAPVPGVNSFPFTGVDTEYLQQVQAYLNSELKQQVARSGDHFVESYPQSLPHSACTGTADPWMNGITLGATGSGVGAEPGSLHPNREGADHLATETLAAIGSYVAPRPKATPSSTHAAARTAGSVGAAPVGAGSAPLADTGLGNVLPLTAIGALLVLLGAVLLYEARFGVRRRGHGR